MKSKAPGGFPQQRPRKIRVVVADDHRLLRETLVPLLSADKRIEVMGEATDGDEAVRIAEEMQPDVLLLDIVMPRRGVYSTLLEVAKKSPRTRVIVLTGYADDHYAMDAARGGAWGYLSKGVSPKTVLAAIKRVARGKFWIDQEHLSPLAVQYFKRSEQKVADDVGQMRKLTPTEERIVQLVAEGMSNDAIAGQLQISPKTVKVHLVNIFKKLRMSNRVQVARWALQKLA